jgi:crossover junction endodeoxyribonuclease RuvC
MRAIGIDPGIGGAIAWIDPAFGVCIRDMPTMGVKNLINAPELIAILLHAQERLKAPHVFIERAQAMPRQGIASAFNYGRGFGTIEGVVFALGLPHTFVAPAAWKRAAGLGSDKRDAVAHAIRMRPDAAPLLRRAKDHGRAEALLLAIHGAGKT